MSARLAAVEKELERKEGELASSKAKTDVLETDARHWRKEAELAREDVESLVRKLAQAADKVLRYGDEQQRLELTLHSTLVPMAASLEAAEQALAQSVMVAATVCSARQSLLTRVESAAHELVRVQRRVAEMEAETAAVRSKHDEELNAQRQELERQRREGVAGRDDLRREHVREVALLKDMHEQERRQHARELARSADELQDAHKGLDAMRAGSKEAQDSAQEEVRRVRQELEEEQDKVQHARKAIEMARGRIKELEDMVHETSRTAEEKQGQLASELASTRMDLSAAEHALATARDAMASAEMALSLERQGHAAARESCAQACDAQREQESMVQRLQQMLAASERALAQHEQQRVLDASMDKLKEAERQQREAREREMEREQARLQMSKAVSQILAQVDQA